VYSLARSPTTSGPVFSKARGLRHPSLSWCTRLYWVGSGRVTVWHVSPIPPLDPYVRLSPHTAHERGTFTGHFHFANSTERSPWSACAFVDYLCTVAPPSPLGPSPSVLVLVYPAFLGSDYYAPFDCLQGLGAFGAGLPCLLPTLLAIPVRLSRVQRGGLQQDAVGGVLLAAPSALCGSPVPAQGKQVRLCLLPHGRRNIHVSDLTSQTWVSGLTGWHPRQGMPGCPFPEGRCTLLVNHHGIS